MNEAFLIWMLGAGLGGIGLVLALLPLAPSYRAYLVRRFVSTVGLGYPAELGARIERTLAARQHLLGAATVVGAGLSVLLVIVVPRSGVVDDYLLIVLGGGVVLTTIAIVQVIAALLRRRRPDAAEVRWARATQTRLGDYVGPFDRVPLWIVVPLAVILTVTAAVLRPDRMPQLGIVIAAAALALAGLLVFEIVGRRIVRRPQPSGSTAELAWNDALRSADLRDVAGFPAATAVYAAFGALVVATADANGTWDWRLSALNLAAVVCISVSSYLSRSQRPQRHVIRRLWPEVAAANELRG